MTVLDTMTAGPRNRANPDATRFPLMPGARTALSALLVLAFAVRLASMFPGAPTPHWHGAVFVVAPGGAYPHPYGSQGCENPARDGDKPVGEPAVFAYFCGLHAPVEPGALAVPGCGAPTARGEEIRSGRAAVGSLVPESSEPRSPPARLEARGRAPEPRGTKEFIRNQA